MTDFVTQQNLDKLELQFYQEIVPDLVAFEKKISGSSKVEQLFPKLFAGRMFFLLIFVVGKLR